MATTRQENKKYILSSTIIRAFDLIEYISNNQPVTTKELLDKFNFGRTQLHRYLSTLINVGYLKKARNTYMLTYKIYKIGSAIPISRNLRDVAKPYMRELMENTKENVYINILVNNRILAIDEVKSPHYLILNPDLTYSFPVHVCASAKLLLGSFTIEERIKFVESLDFSQGTNKTVRDVETLLSMVEEAIQRGYALELGEYNKDLNSIAAPIFDYKNKIVATISISGPAIRLNEEVLNSIIPKIKVAARKISRSLGQSKNE